MIIYQCLQLKLTIVPNNRQWMLVLLNLPTNDNCRHDMVIKLRLTVCCQWNRIVNCFQSMFHSMNSNGVIELLDDLYRVNRLNVMIVVVVVIVDVVGKQFREKDPNFAMQMLTDQNNIDVVAGMMVKGQMKK